MLLKRFISYYKNHMPLFIFDMLAALIIALVDLTFPEFTRYALDNVIPAKDTNKLFTLAAIMIALYLLRAVCNYIVSYWGHVVGTRMEYDMRKDIFGHIQTLSFSYFDKIRTGKIMSRIVNDLRNITELAHHGPEDLFLSIITLVGSFILMIRKDIRLTLIVFAFVPIMLLYGISKRKKMSKAFRQVAVEIADVNARLESSISGIRVVQSYTNEEHEMNKFDEGNVKFKNARGKSFKAMGEMISGITFMSNFLKVVVIAVGGYFYAKDQMSAGVLVSFLLYINLFFQPVRRLMSFTQQLEQGMAGFSRFVDVLEIEPEIKNNINSVDLVDVKGDIYLDNISFAYNDEEENKNVLTNINLHVKKGSTTALVGPSGGGKTTICHLIPRFYDVTGGAIKLDGVNIKDINLRSLRQHIGIVQQDVFLFADTIAENIAYGKPDATQEQIIDAAKRAKIHEFIMTLENGYDTYVGERGVKLSGGQKQRISIARVFLKNPEVLILDEATSALDNETEIAIQQSLEELSKGRTTIVIAHRLSTIRNADQIAVIDSSGHVAEIGTHEILLERKGQYANLYKVQFSVLNGAAGQ